MIMKILLIFFEEESDIYLVLQENETVFLQKYQSYEIKNASNAFHVVNINNFKFSARENMLNSNIRIITF